MTVALLNAGSPTGAFTAAFSSAFSVTASGADRCAFALIVYDNSNGLSISSVTYGGQAMTLVGAVQNATSNQYAAIYRLVNPPTGSNTLAISIPGAAEIYANLVAFTGVDQTTPVRVGTFQGTAGVTDGSSHYSMAITSDAGDMTISVFSVGSGADTISSTNQTSDGIDNGGGVNMASDHCTTPAASVTHTWTASAAAAQAVMAGLSIAAAAAAVVTPSNGLAPAVNPVPMRPGPGGLTAGRSFVFTAFSRDNPVTPPVPPATRTKGHRFWWWM